MNQSIHKSRIQTLINDIESMLIFGIIILATIILATVIGKYLQKKFERKANDQSVYITKFSFIRHILTATIYLFGFG